MARCVGAAAGLGRSSTWPSLPSMRSSVACIERSMPGNDAESWAPFDSGASASSGVLSPMVSCTPFDSDDSASVGALSPMAGALSGALLSGSRLMMLQEVPQQILTHFGHDRLG